MPNTVSRMNNSMAISGRRQTVVITAVAVLVLGGFIAAFMRSNTPDSEPNDVPGVLGAQSGAVTGQAVRTNGAAAAPQSAGNTTEGTNAGTAGQGAAPYSAYGSVARRSGAAATSGHSSLPVTGPASTQPTGGYGNADTIDYKEHPPNESVAYGPTPVGVPTPVVPNIIGRHAIEIPLGSTEPWTDVFKTSDESPVTWGPKQGDPIYWEGKSFGLPSSPAYMILSGDSNVASVSLPYKVIVNDVVAQPGDVVVFTLHAAEIDQSVQLQVTIVE